MSSASGLKLPPVAHVGLVVRDVDRAMEFYSSAFGLGPWRVVEIPGTSPEGQPWKLKLAFAPLGQVMLELIQVLEGRTLHRDFLEQRGEGLHHLGFEVDNFDRWLEALEKRGIGVVMGRRSPEVSFAYLDTEMAGGAIVELIQRARR